MILVHVIEMTEGDHESCSDVESWYTDHPGVAVGDWNSVYDYGRSVRFRPIYPGWEDGAFVGTPIAWERKVIDAK